ncbi:MAG: TolC family outer membrane protein [Gallionellaceae bacterium]
MKTIKSILFALATSVAFPAGAVDLLGIYHTAQSQDAVIAAAAATLKADREKLPQGRSLLLPNVSLNANSSFNDLSVGYGAGLLPIPSGSYNYNSHGYGVNLVQPLYRQQNWLAYTEAELQVAQAEVRFRSAQQDLILRVAQAYFDVLMAQDSVELSGAQKSAITEQLGQAKRNFEVGTATITDTYEAQARYDLTNSEEIAARSNLEIKKRTLQQLINTVPDELQNLGEEFKLDPLQPPDAEKWVEAAQQNSLQLAEAQLGAQLAEKEVTRNKGGYYPTVDLVANYSRTAQSGSNFGVGIDMLASAIGVQVNLPLYQGGAIDSKLREAVANRDRAKEDLENARRSAALQTRQAYLGVVDGMAQVQALQQALKSSAGLLDASKLGQEVGVRTNLDVLNAQQQLYATRRDLYQSEYNYLLSQLRLKAAVGTLSEEDLARVNQTLH